MNSIGTATETLINRSPFLREAMAEDLINISALARKLQPDIEEMMGKKVNEGAIVMAIKRMTPGLYQRLNMKITNMMGDLGDFLVRNNLTDFTFENSDTLKTAQTLLFETISKESDSFFALCQGVTETTYVLQERHSTLVEKYFAKERMKSHNLNLSSVTVVLPNLNYEIYGVYYYLLKHLAWQGINIVEIVSTSTEFTVVVRQADVESAFGILMQLKRKL
jgi:hypothetical protein